MPRLETPSTGTFHIVMRFKERKYKQSHPRRHFKNNFLIQTLTTQHLQL
jgi:hypothetical protein